jgi:hypothetical protein
METARDFDALLQQAWHRHADDPAEVAELLAGDALAAVGCAAHVGALAAIVHHVYGEHLTRWDAGIALMQALSRHPAADDDSRSALRRCLASLALCAGQADEREALGGSDRVRVTAMAAANLALHDAGHAMRWLQEARAEAATLTSPDPAHRALAVAGNNIACALEEKSGRSAAERELMILAATTGRVFWERDGTWLETERAEYRLAMTWLQAGDAAQARQHALACRTLVRANAGAALESFFASEALARAEHALGDAPAVVAAVREAGDCFGLLDESDRSWCEPTLIDLRRLASG